MRNVWIGCLVGLWALSLTAGCRTGAAPARAKRSLEPTGTEALRAGAPYIDAHNHLFGGRQGQDYFAAARQALETAGLAPEDLSYIILATNTPPLMFPACAIQVQEALVHKMVHQQGRNQFAHGSCLKHGLTVYRSLIAGLAEIKRFPDFIIFYDRQAHPWDAEFFHSLLKGEPPWGLKPSGIGFDDLVDAL